MEAGAGATADLQCVQTGVDFPRLPSILQESSPGWNNQCVQPSIQVRFFVTQDVGPGGRAGGTSDDFHPPEKWRRHESTLGDCRDLCWFRTTLTLIERPELIKECTTVQAESLNRVPVTVEGQSLRAVGTPHRRSFRDLVRAAFPSCPT